MKNFKMDQTLVSTPDGSHPRVEAVIEEWLINDSKGLTFGTEKQKAECWQKAASRLERIARQLEMELSANVKVRDRSGSGTPPHNQPS